ncbi:MAG: 23S rRNA (adenine(2503)-C(2))-methyltransferase RlmN [Coriobacteriales bacterium]|nr:23S rRNA (adenine(2503)-C(2))-methyltransferase RlmN [Coriobacteriales bacterium]
MKRATVDTIGFKALTQAELAEVITEELQQPSFRTKQILQWVYQKGAVSFDDMTNVPASLRDVLSKQYPLYTPKIIKKQVSLDGTRKYLIELVDGAHVETVGIPYKDHLSVCVSSQAGCSLRCAFCATGQAGYTRNLGCGEIVDQVMLVARDFEKRVSNVVFMGQGEPFLNYDASIEAARIINEPNCLGIGARHITISTSGILPQIRRFASEPQQFTLAISLHSAIQETRDEIMPGVKNYTLDRLRDSIISYANATGRRPTFEYLMINHVNDSNEHLKALVAFCRGTLCHVNLIPLNPTPKSRFTPSPLERIKDFEQYLTSVGIETTIRQSFGADIDAACGQLKQKYK